MFSSILWRTSKRNKLPKKKKCRAGILNHQFLKIVALNNEYELVEGGVELVEGGLIKWAFSGLTSYDNLIKLFKA